MTALAGVIDRYRSDGIAGVGDVVRDFLHYRWLRLKLASKIYRPGPVTTTIAGVQCRWKIDNQSNWKFAARADDERELLGAFLGDVDGDAVVWDIGAHIGTYTIPAARKGATVVAFEPRQSNVERLMSNVFHNEVLERVTVRNVALGDENATVPFARTDSYASGRVVEDGDDVVEMRRGDDIGGPAPTHVKIDTEGHEVAVLAGMPEVLAEASVVLVEVHDSDAVDAVRQRLAGFDSVRVLDTPQRSQQYVLARDGGVR